MANLENGLVQNGSNFTGQVVITHSTPTSLTPPDSEFGTFSFDTALASDGFSFHGTYSGMPTCTHIGSTGSFSGVQVPSVTGTWSGTLQACTYNQITGVCFIFGSSTPISALLTQDDASGNVTGSYQTQTADLGTGTLAFMPPFDILSGIFLQSTLTSSEGVKHVMSVQLEMDRSARGLVFVFGNESDAYYLVMQH
jgi:hypothetical protein